MGTISAKIIRNPRREYKCVNAGFYRCSPISGPYVRVFGRFWDGEKPFTIKVCMECAQKTTDKKVRAASERSG